MIFYCLEDRPWDSDFFGHKMSKLSLQESETKNSFQSVQALLQFAQQEQSEHIMARIPSDKTKVIHELENAGFRFFGSLIELQKHEYSDGHIKSELQEGDFLKKKELEFLSKWAKDLFRQSYMYKDAFFPPEKVDELHKLWLSNILNTPKTVILVSRTKTEFITGFITLRLEKDCFEIDLFGVHPDYQGKGISKKLLKMGSEYILENYSELPLKVKTQGENIPAMNSYISNGFKIKSYYLTFCHNLLGRTCE